MTRDSILSAVERPYTSEDVGQDTSILEANAELARKQEEHDLREALKNPHARRVLWRFIIGSGIFSTSFDNSGWTGFKEGRRSVGLAMLEDIRRIDPMIIPEMMKADFAIQATRQKPAQK